MEDSSQIVTWRSELTPSQQAALESQKAAAKSANVWIRLTTDNTSNHDVQNCVEAIFYYEDRNGLHELLKLHSQAMPESQMKTVKNDLAGFLMKIINEAFSRVSFE